MTPKSSIEVLDDLVNLLCDEILERSDEEVRQRAVARGVNPEERVKRLRAIARGEVITARKSLLKKARAEYEASAAVRPRLQRSVEEMRRLVRELLSARPDLAGRLTLAARDGRDIPDEDLADLISDLEHLGLLEKKK